MPRKLLPWVVLCAAAIAALTFVNAQPGPVFPTPVVSPAAPNDVVIGAGVTTPESALPFFDDFSWREFIAVTWPAKTSAAAPYSRGIADTTKTYGDTSVPTVLETLKADYELFVSGSTPTAWDQYSTPSPCLGAGMVTPYETVLGSFNHFHGFNQAGFGVEASPLVAQNRTYVRYDTRMNKPEYDFILSPGAQAPGPLYLQANLAAAPAPLVFPNGSIDYKASWRDMTGIPAADKARYYVITAQALDPVTGRCSAREFGLIGLHIVNKTPSFPRWVWSTFEHVDNVPAIAGETTAGRAPWALNDNDAANQRLTMPPPPSINECNPPAASPTPAQVVRIRKIHASTQQTNQLYQTKLAGTVWANYQLTVTQWPTGPNVTTGIFPNTTTPMPQTNTANTAAETWFQSSTATSCMRCHNLASRQDLVFFLIMNALPTPTQPCQMVNAFVVQQREAQEIVAFSMLKGSKIPKTKLDKAKATWKASEPATPLPLRDDTIRALQSLIRQSTTP